jgi:hypothetical protein
LGNLVARTRVDPLHVSSVGLLPHPRSASRSLAQRPPPSDRECPLDTAGDRCLWHAGGTPGETTMAAPADAPTLIIARGRSLATAASLVEVQDRRNGTRCDCQPWHGSSPLPETPSELTPEVSRWRGQHRGHRRVRGSCAPPALDEHLGSGRSAAHGGNRRLRRLRCRPPP